MLSLVDALLVLVLVEALLLGAWHRLTGRGLPPRSVLPNLTAGALLMLALRCALMPATGLWAPLACLAGAGVCHALDLRIRWRTRPSKGEGPG